MALRILKHQKKAIGWKISDFYGISMMLCIPKVYMEEGHNPTTQYQRRLSPMMKEVVRKKVIKWVDVGTIFPISDSKWVGLVQCVLNK